MKGTEVQCFDIDPDKQLMALVCIGYGIYLCDYKFDKKAFISSNDYNDFSIVKFIKRSELIIITTTNR